MSTEIIKMKELNGGDGTISVRTVWGGAKVGKLIEIRTRDNGSALETWAMLTPAQVKHLGKVLQDLGPEEPELGIIDEEYLDIH